MKAYEKAAKGFFEKYGIDSGGIDSAIGGLQHWKDRASVSKLGGQTGKQTGRSLLPVAAGAATFGLSRNPELAAIVTALATPVMNPALYLGALQKARDVVGKVGESKAAQMFGESWPAVQSALSRQAGVRGSDEFQKSQGLDTGAVPEKIKAHLRRGGG
jgi:hypothetical protein